MSAPCGAAPCPRHQVCSWSADGCGPLRMKDIEFALMAADIGEDIAATDPARCAAAARDLAAIIRAFAPVVRECVPLDNEIVMSIHLDRAALRYSTEALVEAVATALRPHVAKLDAARERERRAGRATFRGMRLPEDEAAVLALQAACYPSDLCDDAPSLQGLDGILVEVDGKVVAGAFGRVERALTLRGAYELYSVETLPTFRRLGLGRRAAERLLAGQSSVYARAVSSEGMALCRALGLGPSGETGHIGGAHPFTVMRRVAPPHPLAAARNASLGLAAAGGVPSAKPPERSENEPAQERCRSICPPKLARAREQCEGEAGHTSPHYIDFMSAEAVGAGWYDPPRTEQAPDPQCTLCAGTGSIMGGEHMGAVEWLACPCVVPA